MRTQVVLPTLLQTFTWRLLENPMSFPIFLRTFVVLNYETTEIYIIFLITNKQIKKYEKTIYFIDAIALCCSRSECRNV